MAIAFAQVSVHTRSKGHSSVAGSAYRAGDRRVDERTGEIHDFSNRKDVLHSEIMLPDAADGCFKSGEALWNTVEVMENRKDSQVAKDVVLALPKELPLSKQIELARDFANYHFVSKGLAVEFAVHDHSDGNPHAHIYVTTRRLHAHGFDEHKARDLNPVFANSSSGKGFVSEGDYWGEQWRDFQNGFFEKNGLGLTVDENHLIPTKHEGRVRGDEQHYVKEKNQLQRETVRRIALNDTVSLLNLISQRYAVFTEKQISSVLFKVTASGKEFQTAMIKLKAHCDVICLGSGDDGELCYTTRQTFQKETVMVERAGNLAGERRSALPLQYVSETLLTKAAALTAEQAEAVRSVTSGSDLAIVVGRAGTGKSFMLKTANGCWEAGGFRVHGVSVSGIAAKNLQNSSGIPSSTIARFKRQLEHGHLDLDNKSIVVMDEAGMTDLADMAFIIEKVYKARAKLVLVGDPEQLQPIGAGSPLRVLARMFGFTEIETIRRQDSEGDRAASYALSRGDVGAAMAHYEKESRLHWHENLEKSFQHIADNYLTALNRPENTLFSSIVLAHRNSDVDQLNDGLRAALIETKKISASGVLLDVVRTVPDDLGWETVRVVQQKEFAVGDKILFRKNDKELGVTNGEFAIVTAVQKNGGNTTLSVAFENGRALAFNPQAYQEFDYGYASTIHKSQGMTIDNAHVFVSGRYWDRHLTYVALTRHRKNLQIYVDKESFLDKKKLDEDLSRKQPSDSVFDWPLAFARHRGFDTVDMFKRLLHRAGKKFGELVKAVQDPWQLKAVLDKQLSAQQSQNTDWLSPQFAKDWENLRGHSNKDIQWMVKFVELGRTKDTAAEKQKINASISALVKKLDVRSQDFTELQEQAPALASVMRQAQSKPQQKNIGMEREN